MHRRFSRADDWNLDRFVPGLDAGIAHAVDDHRIGAVPLRAYSLGNHPGSHEDVPHVSFDRGRPQSRVVILICEAC